MSRKFKISWLLIAFIFGLTINETNLYFVKKENPNNVRANEKSTMFGYSIYNVDHEWYLPQIKNMMAGNGYTLEPNNPEMKVRRTPLYPLFYGTFYYLFGEENSFFVIRYIQLFLFSLAAVLIGISVFNFTGNIHWGKCCTYLFSFSPFIFIYAYHTITEGLIPFLVVLSLYFFSCYHSTRYKRYLVLTGIAVALSVLNRPLTGFMLPAFLLCLIEKKFFSAGNLYALMRKTFYVIVPFVLTIIPWTIRNYFVTGGEFVPLEKIYYEDPMDFGRGHYYFRYWISCWANPAMVSAEQFSNSLRDNIRKGKTGNDSLINDFISHLPAYAFQNYSVNEVRDALQKLNACFVHKQQLINENAAIKRKELAKCACEDEAKNSFLDLAVKFRANAPLRYYVVTPFTMVGQGIFQSNTLFWGSLNPAGGNFSFLQKIIKALMYALNVALFFSALFFLFFCKGQTELKFIISTMVVLTFFSLVYFFNRYLDARYLLPLYPFLYISLSYFVHLIFARKAKA